MILAATREILGDSLRGVRDRGLRLGLVPTMGYLHEGHLSLVDLARDHCEFLAASVFVNPLQFGPGEDLDRYPRDLDRDLSLLESRGADMVFFPSVEEMYPGGDPVVTVDPGPMGNRLCGRFRPGHFPGVLTVVARLFGLFRPQVAVFGQKDYQQAILIRRMVLDLELDVEVLLGPIVREEDGLALSSRNVFLSGPDRNQAAGLHRGLLTVQGAVQEGIRSGERLKAILRQSVEEYPRLTLQYGEVVDPDTLKPVGVAKPGDLVAVAAFCGSTRLIDNHILEG